MLIVDDYAFHQKTGIVGKVIGYGDKIVNDSYLQTLRVRVKQPLEGGKTHLIIEDLVSRWMPVK